MGLFKYLTYYKALGRITLTGREGQESRSPCRSPITVFLVVLTVQSGPAFPIYTPECAVGDKAHERVRETACVSKEENELKEVEGTVPELLRGTLAAVGSTRRSITWSTVWLLNTLRFGVWWTGKEALPFRQTRRGTVPQLGTTSEWGTQRKVK